MCECVCVCASVYVSVQVCVCMRECVCVCASVCASVYVSVWVCMCLCKCVCVCASVRTCRNGWRFRQEDTAEVQLGTFAHHGPSALDKIIPAKKNTTYLYYTHTNSNKKLTTYLFVVSLSPKALLAMFHNTSLLFTSMLSVTWIRRTTSAFDMLFLLIANQLSESDCECEISVYVWVWQTYYLCWRPLCSPPLVFRCWKPLIFPIIP